MKKKLICLFSVCIVITNIYLIFYWEPQSKCVTQEEVSKEAVSYSQAVYKFDKRKVLERLSSNDKRDLEKIIKKLSAFDLGKIKEYYEDYNDEEGVVSIFTLLRQRLTTGDYKQIHEISSSFLDLERIDQKIKKIGSLY
ncbi:hypothetical protein psyc5s11_05890 [Clostridium gelidum]|uniref:Uncharacterized protein n=1 Tax=Clostridium gelidum TaxID=704125 RepID=A0ABN6IVX4_9CLOT|nr:hypothetical protein [Clostridium gelidum]BCZ44522.1 hypothetical protein psyc5s11_05890 [Clostridium gelidum]